MLQIFISDAKASIDAASGYYLGRNEFDIKLTVLQNLCSGAKPS
jgi:hypothetical protein